MIGLKEAFEDSPPLSALPALTESVFSEGGWLQDALALESRPQQEDMALSVAQAFSADSALVFEAGTGVGKSLAYLVPAIMHAMDRKRQCVVSTHTIALQEQIQNNDLPMSRLLFDRVPELEKYRDFKTALLVGRGNYLCSTRLAQAIATRSELFRTTEQQELERLADWSQVTKDGILHELNPPLNPEVWDWVNADSGACNRKNCSPETCFFQKARARLRTAQVIIVNHSLLFSLINAGVGPPSDLDGVLFAEDFVVLDEAHTIPAVATDQLGHRLSSVGLDRLLKRLYNPRRKKGLLSRYGAKQDCQAVETAVREAQSFFADVARRMLSKQSIVRLRQEGWCAPTLNPVLKTLAARVATVADRLDDGPEREDLLDLRTRINSYNSAINECIDVSDEDKVYWTERTGRKGTNVTLRASPIDVAPILREHLFRRGTSVVLTSATLAEGSDMSGFLAKVGADGETAEKVTSPFDFEANMRVFVATDAPQPTRGKGQLDIDFLISTIGFCTLRVRGGSLVLFTSYADMQRVAEELDEPFTEAGRLFLVQGRDGPRSEITYRFREAGNAVLFGTDSFWAGVDVPGPSLSQVIITRLPFENPGHPVAEAKSDWVRARGGNPFAELTLPEAILKFRQGVGRLIRNKTDCGTITLLDSRLLSREYGRRFLAMLPVQEFQRFNRMNREEAFQPLETGS